MREEQPRRHTQTAFPPNSKLTLSRPRSRCTRLCPWAPHTSGCVRVPVWHAHGVTAPRRLGVGATPRMCGALSRLGPPPALAACPAPRAPVPGVPTDAPEERGVRHLSPHALHRRRDAAQAEGGTRVAAHVRRLLGVRLGLRLLDRRTHGRTWTTRCAQGAQAGHHERGDRDRYTSGDRYTGCRGPRLNCPQDAFPSLARGLRARCVLAPACVWARS